MSIERVEMFEYKGRVFATEKKAVDFAESLVGDAIKAACIERGFTVAEWVRITEIVIDHRAQLIDLLDY